MKVEKNKRGAFYVEPLRESPDKPWLPNNSGDQDLDYIKDLIGTPNRVSDMAIVGKPNKKFYYTINLVLDEFEEITAIKNIYVYEVIGFNNVKLYKELVIPYEANTEEEIKRELGEFVILEQL